MPAIEGFNRSETEADEEIQGNLRLVAVIFDRYSNMIRAMERFL